LGFYGGFSDTFDFMGCYHVDPQQYNYYRRRAYILLKYALMTKNREMFQNYLAQNKNHEFSDCHDANLVFGKLVNLNDHIFICVIKFI